MTRTRFYLVLLLAGLIGFALGWFARRSASRDIEERARDAVYRLLRQIRGK